MLAGAGSLLPAGYGSGIPGCSLPMQRGAARTGETELVPGPHFRRKYERTRKYRPGDPAWMKNHADTSPRVQSGETVLIPWYESCSYTRSRDRLPEGGGPHGGGKRFTGCREDCTSSEGETGLLALSVFGGQEKQQRERTASLQNTACRQHFRGTGSIVFGEEERQFPSAGSAG